MAATSSTSPRRIPLRDFFRDRPVRAFQLSPDGKNIGYVKLIGKARQPVFFVRPSGGSASDERCLMPESDDNFVSCSWKGSDLLLLLEAASDGTRHLYRLDVNSGSGAEIDLPDFATFNLLDALDGVSSDEILLEVRDRAKLFVDVARLNISTGELTIVARNPGGVYRWVVDNRGQVCAAIQVKGRNENLLVRPDEKSKFRTLKMDFRFCLNQYGPIFYSADNKALIAVSRRKARRDKQAIAIISTKTGRELRTIYQNSRVDVQSFAFSKRRKIVTYAVFHDSKPKVAILDKATAAIFKALRKKLRGYVIELTSSDQSEQKFIVRANDDRTPARYYFFDCRSNKLTRLAFAVLRKNQLAPVRPIRFRNKGLTIHGYLTLPLRRAAKGLPLVVCVHGGPDLRDFWYYVIPDSAEVQFFANRGYAVLQVNYRGSAGYGRAFWVKGFKQRGRKMQDDVHAAVHHLIKKGIVDPERVAIYGRSFGGFAALAGIAFTPKLFRAAITSAGVSNWITWFNALLPHDQPWRGQLCVKVGHPVKDRRLLEAVAPALHADGITAPLLIAHGARDSVVRKAESDRMVAAIQNSPVTYMVIPNEGHPPYQSVQNRIAFYRAVEIFLATHLR